MKLDSLDYIAVAPELFLLTVTCVVLVVDLCLRQEQRGVTYLLSLLGLAATAALTYSVQPAQPVIAFYGSFVADGMATLLKLFVCLITAVVFVYSRRYLQNHALFQGEFFVLGLFAVLGMMVIISAHSLITIYLGLELLSLALYALVALHRDSSTASEAAMKYFVLGALASGMLLYGMSLIYGVTGTVGLSEVAAVISGHDVDGLVLSLGLVFVITGLAFKLGLAPFHMWVPDIYHGAPTCVTLFVSSAPKIAAFAMLMRLLVEGLGVLHVEWQLLLIVLAVLSMAVGNIIAIAQSNLKRMLAYSAIAHMGFMLLGVLTGTAGGYAGAMFYIVVYAVMGVGGFGMILLLTRSGFEADRLEDFKGLNERSPWFAFVMLVIMFSMAGVPPSVGFWAKLSVLQALVDAGIIWLAVVAVILAVIGAYYYLRVVWYMYFEKPVDGAPLEGATDMRLVMSLNGIAVLGLGIYPTALLAYCASVLA